MITLVLGLAMMETPRHLARHALLALAVVAQVSGIGCDGAALASVCRRWAFWFRGFAFL